MADGKQGRNLPTDDLGTANEDSKAAASEHDEQAGLSRRRPREQHVRESTTTSASRQVPMSVPPPTTLIPSSDNRRSSSRSPARRLAGAVAEAVSTALRKAITSQCCVKSTDEASSLEEASPQRVPSPEALLKTSPEKPCLRRSSPPPNPDAIVPNLKVSFTGVPEEVVAFSFGEPDCWHSGEDQLDEHRQADELQRSSQSTQGSQVDPNILRIRVEIHPPPTAFEQPERSACGESKEDPENEDAPNKIKKGPK